MKKKLLTIAVTAAMVFSLVACGSNGGSNETKAVETSASETAAGSAVSEGDGEKTLKAGATTGFLAQRVWILRTTGMDGLCPFMVLVRTCSD